MYRTIKIEFIPDKEAEYMLLKNCRYRHFLYNKCVALVKQNQDNDSDRHVNINKYELLHQIRTYFEKSFSVRPDYLEDYDYYFRGISECVVDDIMSTIQRVISNRNNNLSSDINFSKYDPNNLSFRFKNKVCKSKYKMTANRFVLTDNSNIVGVKINNTYGYPLGINLRESIDKFCLNINDIKEIAFKFHNDKWWICLILYYDPLKIIKDNRIKVCGIDLGETNPVVMYDGRVVKIPKHLEYPKDQVDKYNRKIENCQRIMDRKYRPELKEARLPQSKNYYKVLRKFHKYWERKKNIVKDWHFKLAHWIVTHYKNIVVDEFRNHIININQNYTKFSRKRYNRSMCSKSMILFKKILIHMSHKYGTNYFSALPDTTNTCNVCGHVNKIKLRIDETHNERIFKCESCGYTIDRDVNAAINCYNLYNNKTSKNLFLELI